MTIDFGIANPALFVLLSDPARGPRSPAAQQGAQILADRVHRVALTGRLQISEDRAVELIHAAGTGAVLTTLAKPLAKRDRRLADMMFDAIVEQLLTPASTTPEAAMGGVVAHAVSLPAHAVSLPAHAASVRAHAVSLRAHVSDAMPLSRGERVLLAEWLDRIVDDE